MFHSYGGRNVSCILVRCLEGKKCIFILDNIKKPKANQTDEKKHDRLQRNMLGCFFQVFNTCPSHTFRYLPCTCFGYFQCSYASSSFAGGPGQGAWPGVCRGFPGPCGAQMRRAASCHPVHMQRARAAAASPALHRGAVTARTEHLCHQTGSAHRDCVVGCPLCLLKQTVSAGFRNTAACASRCWLQHPGVLWAGEAMRKVTAGGQALPSRLGAACKEQEKSYGSGSFTS